MFHSTGEKYCKLQGTSDICDKYDLSTWVLMLLSVRLEDILYDWSFEFARPVVVCIID